MVYAAIRSLVINVSSSNMPSGPLPPFTGADRLTGITRQEAAEAATRNVIDSQHDVNIRRLVDDLIRSKGSTSAKSRKALKEFSKGNSSKFKIKPYRSSIFIDPKNLDHTVHINEILSASSHALTLGPILKEVMNGYLCEHSENLDWLRERYSHVHYLLVLGETKAIVAYLLSHPIPPEDIAKVTQIIAHHIKLFAVRTAQDLAAMIGIMYTNPYRHCFSGFNHWKSTSHVVLSTLAAPASVLQRLIKDIPKEIDPEHDDDKAVAKAIENGTISKAYALEIIALAKATSFWKRQQSNGNQNIDIWNVLQRVATRAQPAAALKLGHMRTANFIEEQYVEHHLLLTAAESVTYVAVQLLKACSKIDRAIPAMLNSGLVPPNDPEPFIKASGNVGFLLRAGGRSDPSAAAHMDRRKNKPKNFDRCNFPGRDHFASMNRKLSDPSIAESASRHLSIDANEWLLR
ncbi:hypothetical protein E5673_10210 [Sphingomonas sp. PAMC26645]|uniref:hypothetical protein n=1 Tax=Sphingomonas sp. PAMC26645 TaxID=2565555 RepID=UPI00109E294A|nr:hypothetical protein [Sphingomonas sp. PAMC26645]QCB42555.1 hypothetical protein E5673_10210 [Sphingomonas sp. PAMC26645]